MSFFSEENKTDILSRLVVSSCNNINHDSLNVLEASDINDNFYKM